MPPGPDSAVYTGYSLKEQLSEIAEALPSPFAPRGYVMEAWNFSNLEMRLAEQLMVPEPPPPAAICVPEPGPSKLLGRALGSEATVLRHFAPWPPPKTCWERILGV